MRSERQRALDRADEWFSKYVRLSYSKDGKNVECYTCGTIKPIEEMQNGHGIGGRGMYVRYLEEICRPQCPRCNRQTNGLSGNYEVFVPKLCREIGLKQYEEHVKNARKPFKMGSLEIRYVADKYRKLYNHLKAQYEN